MTKINLGLHSHQIFGIEMKPESLAQWFISAYKGVAYGRQVSRLGATARRCNAGIRFLERSNSQPWLDNAFPLSALALADRYSIISSALGAGVGRFGDAAGWAKLKPRGKSKRRRACMHERVLHMCAA